MADPIETLKTEHMSTKNVNKNDTEHKAKHTGTQHNDKKIYMQRFARSQLF